MSEDLTYLLLCYLLFGLTLAIYIFRSKNRKRTTSIHFSVACIYSAFFIFNLNTNNEGGAGLVWLVFLMIALLTHSLINLVGIGLTFTKMKNRF
jgi:peptidoglycan/LPS O-acetylase OafA/YrhL